MSSIAILFGAIVGFALEMTGGGGGVFALSLLVYALMCRRARRPEAWRDRLRTVERPVASKIVFSCGRVRRGVHHF